MDWCDCDWNDSSWALPTNWCVPTDNDIKKTLVEVFMWYDVQIQLQIREIWNHLESVPNTTGPAFDPDCYKPDIRAANNDPSDLCTPKRKAITAMLLERIESVIEQLKDVGFPGTAADIHYTTQMLDQLATLCNTAEEDCTACARQAIETLLPIQETCFGDSGPKNSIHKQLYDIVALTIAMNIANVHDRDEFKDTLTMYVENSVPIAPNVLISKICNSRFQVLDLPFHIKGIGGRKRKSGTPKSKGRNRSDFLPRRTTPDGHDSDEQRFLCL